MCSSARPPRAISATTALASVQTRACNGLRELRPGHAVGDGLEPLDGLGAEDEADIARRHLVAPAGHGCGGDLGVLEEDPRGLRGLEAEGGDVEEERPAAGRADERPAREAGEHRVAAALELGDALGHVALVSAQDGGGREAGDRHGHRRVVDVRPARVGDGVGGAGDPADAPADHPVLLRERADDDSPLRHPVHAQRVDERPAVEEQALHRGVVDEEEVALPAEVADREPVVLVEVAARGHGRAHEQEAGGLRADQVVEPAAVEAPAVLLGEERDEARCAAREANAVDDPCVGRVGDDHLVARIHGAEEGVQQAFHPARGDDDLALGVVAVAGALGGEVRDRGAQVEVAGEGEPAVRLRVVELRARDLERLGREREVGVEVLHAEDRAAVAAPCFLRGSGDAVDSEADDSLQPLGPLDHEDESIHGMVSP